MGYTQYWYRKESLSNGWKNFINDVQELYTNLPLVSYWGEKKFRTNQKLEISGWNGEGDPIFNEDEVKFNGRGALAHETFKLSRILLTTETYSFDKDGYYFDFCKTARKPYDIFVTAVLLLAKKHFNKNIKISSDGDWDDWEEGKRILKSVLNYEFKNPIF